MKKLYHVTVEGSFMVWAKDREAAIREAVFASRDGHLTGAADEAVNLADVEESWHDRCPYNGGGLTCRELLSDDQEKK